MERKTSAKKVPAKEPVEVVLEDDAQEAEIVTPRAVKPKKKKKELVVVEKKQEVAPATPSSLMAMAIEKKVDVEVLERLVAMQENWEKKEAKKAFDRSMAAFQADCPTIKKTKQVRTKSNMIAYSYAPIESIVSQVKDILLKHGFSYSTSMELQDKGVKVAVKVIHEQGHFEVSEMAVPFGTMTAIMSASQQAAAAQTFAKRYAFCNAFGILTGDEDNDGANIPTGERASDVRPTAPAPVPSRTIQMEADPEPVTTAPAQPVAPAGRQQHRCEVGAEVITEQEAIYSIRMFGRPLCRTHQKEANHK